MGKKEDIILELLFQKVLSFRDSSERAGVGHELLGGKSLGV